MRTDESRKRNKLVPAHMLVTTNTDVPIRFRVVTGDTTAIYECERDGPGVPSLGDLPREMLDGAVLYVGDAGMARATK